MLFLVILIVPQSFAADFDNSTELTSDIPIDDEIEDINVDEEISQNSDNILSINQEDNVLSDSEAIYVSTDGDDYNNGDETSPYKTLYRAINVAQDTGVPNIYIKNGTYFESGLEIQTSVKLIGIGEVIIDAENTNRIFKVNGQYNVEFYNLTLINGNAPADEWDYGDHSWEVIWYAAGGAVDIKQAHVTMENMKFINNSADDFGGAINVDGNLFSIKNSIFENNYAGVHAGAIDIEGNNSIVDKCKFIANSAGVGGAIGCIGNAATIINSIFENNTVNGYEHGGGAINIQNGPYSNDNNAHLIKNNKFINNDAVQQGGAINVENQQMNNAVDWTVIEGNEFINNTSFNGGAISAYYGDTLVRDNLFVDNRADYGGAIASITTVDSTIYIVGGLYLKNNTIINCKAAEIGNAIFNRGYLGSTLNITFVEGKTVYNKGKAIDLNVSVCDDVGNPISGSPLKITVGSKDTINPSSDLIEGIGSVHFVPRENGTFVISGVYWSDQLMNEVYNVVNGTLIVENATPDYFGIIHVSELEGDDDNTGSEDSPVKTFRQAYLLAVREGGSYNMVINKGTYVVEGFTIEKSFNITGIDNPILDGKNQATLLSLYGDANDEFHIKGLTFKNGVASPSRDASIYEGGAIFLKGGNLYLEDNVFTSNSAKDYGGAVYINKGMDSWGRMYDAYAYITNCTFKNNEANYFGGALGLYDSNVIVKNCNFQSNRAKTGGAISIVNGMGNLTVVNCSFKLNKASEFGGALDIAAIYTRYFAKVYNSTFTLNTANNGGAVNAEGSTISNCIFMNNNAYYGGAIFSNTTFLGEAITDKTIVEYSIFDNNIADISGLDYYGTSYLVNNNFWGNNFNSLNGLKGSNHIFFVSDNDKLTWVNIEIKGSENVTLGSHEYLLKFVFNNGNDLNGTLPDYKVKLSNNILNNTLDVNEAIISDNTCILHYNATAGGNDVLVVKNINNVLITAKDIEIKGQTPDIDNDSSVVVKKVTKLTVPNKTIVVTSNNKKVTILLADSEGNPISNKIVNFKINGVSSSVKTNFKGEADIKLNLKVNTYKLTVKFEGDNNYKSVSKVATIKVIKEKTKLKVPKKTYKKSSKSKKVYITLKSASGKALSKKKVTFKLNGKKYSAKTNSKGKAIVKVKLNVKKTYKYTVKFAGDSKFSPISKKARIKIK